jgi:uncharacterized membrane protein
MVFNPYILVAAVSMVVVAALYVIKFYIVLNLGFADDSAIWGQFGDYMGGSLNPILSFISIILLIKSLSLQNQANSDLREELQENKQTEKLRSFSALFFNMISSQKSLLEGFTVKTNSENIPTPGVRTIIWIEDAIADLRENGAEDDAVISFLNEIDVDDKIFGILRAFYITIKIIAEKLSDANGFNLEDRKDQILTLINFTDFAQLRLIIIGAQFFDTEASRYLKENGDLKLVLAEVNLNFDLY